MVLRDIIKKKNRVTHDAQRPQVQELSEIYIRFGHVRGSNTRPFYARFKDDAQMSFD